MCLFLHIFKIATLTYILFLIYYMSLSGVVLSILKIFRNLLIYTHKQIKVIVVDLSSFFHMQAYVDRYNKLVAIPQLQC